MMAARRWPETVKPAGLICAWYPDLTNDELQQLIEDSADPIDELNPGYEGLLGAGRINAANCLMTAMEKHLCRKKAAC